MVCNGSPFPGQLEVVEIALDQGGPSSERKIALIDKNRDLYLSPVRRLGREPCICKIGQAWVHSLTIDALTCSLTHHRPTNGFTHSPSTH